LFLSNENSIFEHLEPTSYILSKTAFIKLEQCEKSFYFYRKMPYLRDKVDTDKQLTFLRGHTIGFVARELFPGGSEGFIQGMQVEEAVRHTKALIDQGVAVIYEAAFVFNSVLIINDILVYENGKYNGYEIKSSLKVSETYIKDACLQYYVMQQALPNFDEMFLVTINGDYVANEAFNVRDFFKKRSIKTRAIENFKYFDYKIELAKEVIDRGVIPDIKTGLHCFKPYQCDFFGTCWKNQSNSDSIFNLPLIDKGVLLDWYYQGFHDFNEVPEHFFTKDIHKNIRHALVIGEPYVNKLPLSEWVNKIKGRKAAFDIEVWAPAIPEISGTKPFEQIPFLVSIANGESTQSFLTPHQPDARRELAQFLCDKLQDYEVLLVYDKTLEVSVINQLANLYPEFQTLLKKIEQKIVDVFDVILHGYYYHPGLMNNFSLKRLSALLFEINYQDIASGLEAMHWYAQMRGPINDIEKEIISQRLKEYCELDALGTLKAALYFEGMV